MSTCNALTTDTRNGKVQQSTSKDLVWYCTFIIGWPAPDHDLALGLLTCASELARRERA